jgi:hypothetical protein
MGTTTVHPRRIFRVTVRFADGRSISRQARFPVNPRKKTSLRSMERRLADLKVRGSVVSSRTTAPARPKHRKACKGHTCHCFPHWTELPRLMEEE